MALLKQSTAYTRAFYLVQSADHITGLTAAAPTVNISKAGAAFGAAAGTVTEIANGFYKVALTSADTGTLGDLAYHITAASADPTDFVDQVVAFDTQDAAALGLSRIDAAISSRMATFTLPTNFSALAVTVGGAVTVGTNNDKTGYSLTQAFPTNFSSMAITVGGALTVGTNNDKTGYALTQTFPANFATLSIDAGGNVATTDNIKKNSIQNGFMFVMTDSVNHNPKTGLTVTATRSIDGGAFASCANSVVEVANGTYTINLAAADTNGNHIMLRFTATGADDLNIELVTQP